MKIEFENSFRRLSFLRRLTDIKNASINPWSDKTLPYISLWLQIPRTLDRNIPPHPTSKVYSFFNSSGKI